MEYYQIVWAMAGQRLKTPAFQKNEITSRFVFMIVMIRALVS